MGHPFESTRSFSGSSARTEETDTQVCFGGVKTGQTGVQIDSITVRKEGGGWGGEGEGGRRARERVGERERERERERDANNNNNNNTTKKERKRYKGKQNEG